MKNKSKQWIHWLDQYTRIPLFSRLCISIQTLQKFKFEHRGIYRYIPQIFETQSTQRFVKPKETPICKFTRIDNHDQIRVGAAD